MASTVPVISWMRQQGFVLGIFAVVLLALVWPDPASSRHALLVVNLAVALIFFLQGLSLPLRRMLSGAQPVRLHVFVLGWNFILFPALAALLSAPLASVLGRELSMGLWMLAILPTTIASATALTIATGGAVPQAIFASVFSNLLAILLVPLLALAYLSSARGVELFLMPVLMKLCWIVLVPLLIGQSFRRVAHECATAITGHTGWLPQAAILFIIYLSFAQSVASGLVTTLPLGQLAAAFFAVLLMLSLVSWAVWQSSAWLNLKADARLSAFFSASQKSIATGLPLLTTIFASASLSLDTGLVLVPLLLYHSLQLFLGGLLVPRFKSRAAPSVRS